MVKERVLNLITEVKKFVYSKNETDDLLDLKADLIHTHCIDDVTDLGEELDSLETDLNNKADINHNHLISDVTNLSGALDDKADVNHNHDDRYYDIPTMDIIIQDIYDLIDPEKKKQTFINLISDSYEVIEGESVILTATLTNILGNFVKDATIEFHDGETLLDSAVTDVNGECDISTIPIADNSIIALFNGNTVYLESESEPINIVVNEPVPTYLFYDDCTSGVPTDKYQVQSGLTAQYITFQDEQVLSISGTTARFLRPIVNRTQNDIRVTWRQYLTNTAAIGNYYCPLVFNNVKNAAPPGAYPWYMAGYVGGSLSTGGIRKDNTGSYVLISDTFTCPKQEWITFELTIQGDTFTLKRLETGQTVTTTDSSYKGLNLEFYNGQYPVYLKNIKIEEI